MNPEKMEAVRNTNQERRHHLTMLRCFLTLNLLAVLSCFLPPYDASAGVMIFRVGVGVANALAAGWAFYQIRHLTNAVRLAEAWLQYAMACRDSSIIRAASAADQFDAEFHHQHLRHVR